MQIGTKYFGKINLDEDKIVEFPYGIMGFEEFTKYTILYDGTDEEEAKISWLQSVEEESLALPIMNPYLVKPDYNPVIESDLLESLGELNEENIIIFLSLTAPADITKTTVNLKAPFIINSETRKGCQIIAENQDYEIKYNIYEQYQQMKQKKGGL